MTKDFFQKIFVVNRHQCRHHRPNYFHLPPHQNLPVLPFDITELLDPKKKYRNMGLIRSQYAETFQNCPRIDRLVLRFRSHIIASFAIIYFLSITHQEVIIESFALWSFRIITFIIIPRKISGPLINTFISQPGPDACINTSVFFSR